MQKDKRPIYPRQTLLDLAVQHYGSVEGILDLVKSGQFAEFTTVTDASKIFRVGPVLDADVVAEFTRSGIVPTTHRTVGSGGAFSNGFSNGFS